jgi:hypothetical protein
MQRNWNLREFAKKWAISGPAGVHDAAADDGIKTRKLTYQGLTRGNGARLGIAGTKEVNHESPSAAEPQPRQRKTTNHTNFTNEARGVATATTPSARCPHGFSWRGRAATKGKMSEESSRRGRPSARGG